MSFQNGRKRNHVFFSETRSFRCLLRLYTLKRVHTKFFFYAIREWRQVVPTRRNRFICDVLKISQLISISWHLLQGHDYANFRCSFEKHPYNVSLSAHPSSNMNNRAFALSTSSPHHFCQSMRACLNDALWISKSQAHHFHWIFLAKAYVVEKSSEPTTSTTFSYCHYLVQWHNAHHWSEGSGWRLCHACIS